MNTLTVLKYPHPILEIKCKSVSPGKDDIEEFARALVDTMQSFKGCVGIAAPQVGKSLRIVAFDVSRNKKVKGLNHGLTVLINPRITAREGMTVNREGCLSVPDFTGNVMRAERITASALNVKGDLMDYEFEGFESIVAQHECDHLDGILFINRISSIKSNLFARKRYK